MTRDEAIERLRAIQEPEVWEPQITDEAFKALEMAIDALKNQDEGKPKKVISRSYAEKTHDRIMCAIRHIVTAIDVDDWAKDIAVEAMREQLGKYAPYLDQDPDEHEAVIDVLEEMEVET